MSPRLLSPPAARPAIAAADPAPASPVASPVASLVGAPVASPARPAAFHRPELDLLRFGAFVLVFLHHWLPMEAEGWQGLGASERVGTWLAGTVLGLGRGVDLFFALSSYLITELLLRETERFGAVDVRAFWVRRALRIWPLYFVALLAACTVVPRLLPGDALTTGQLAWFALFAGNWWTALRGFPDSFAAVLWSVSVEEQFYLAWPLLLRRVGTRWLGPACVALLVVAPAVRASLAWRGAEHPAMWADTFARLDLFAGGALLALALRRRAVPVPRLSAATRGALAMGGLATYAWLGIEWAYDGWHAVGGYTAGVVASLALVVAALGVRVRVDAPLVRAGLFLGRISYGLYVVHMLALRLGARWVGVGAHPRGGALLAQGAVALALTVGLAVLSYHAIERPFLRLKDRFARVPSRAT